MAEDEKKEERAPQTNGESAAFIGGEVRIVADAKTGGVQISSPPNIIAALGIIELAKSILLDGMKMKAAQAQRDLSLTARPSIVPANGAMMKDLDARLKLRN